MKKGWLFKNEQGPHEGVSTGGTTSMTSMT